MVVCPFHHERGRREDRVPASTRGPLCDTSRTKCTEGITTGVAEDIPAFPAQWFDGLCRALPGDEFVLPPSLRELVAKLEPGWATFASAKLDTSNGCQDHTVLPYAATLLVLHGSIAHSPRAALRSFSRATLSRPPQPALHVS